MSRIDLSGPIEIPDKVELPFPTVGADTRYRVRPIPPRGTPD